MFVLNQTAPALELPPPTKRKNIKWNGPTLSEISLMHKGVTGGNGINWGKVITGIRGERREIIFTLSLPWDRLLYGPWLSTKRRWAFHGLNHLLLNRYIGRKPRAGGYVPVSLSTVKAFLGNPIGPEVFSAAREMGVMDCDNRYEMGRRSNGYRFTPEALAYGPAITPAPMKLAADIRRNRCLSNKLAGDPVAQAIWKTFPRITWGDGIENSLMNRLQGQGSAIVKGLCAIRAVEGIHRRHWALTPDENTGRLFHPVANCPSDLRPCLLMDGEVTGEADIASSQPFLLGALAYIGDDSAEAKAFRELTCSDRFYETFGEWVGLAHLDKKEIKELFYIEVLFGEWWCKGKLWDAMESRFPKLAKFIDRVKANDHCALAALLQRKEASLVIQRIIPALHAQGIDTIPIHDGLLAKRSHLAAVRECMLAFIGAETGLRPLVRIK